MFKKDANLAPFQEDASASVTLPEAEAVLNVPRGALEKLCALVPPLAPVAGFLTVRQVLGLSLLATLPAVEIGDAVQIATAAAEGADLASVKLLAVAFDRGAPVLGWVGSVTDDLARVVMLLPVNKMFRDLSARLAHGEAAPVGRLN